VTVRMDVTSVVSIMVARYTVFTHLGSVDVLVNNAAVLLHENDDAFSIPPDACRRTFDTNLFGVVEVCRAFAPDMTQARWGRIVYVSSGAGQLARLSGYAPSYSMSKTALNAFTGSWPIATERAGCWSTPSILAGSARTWEVSRHQGRSKRAPTPSCGWPHYPTVARRVGSSVIAAPSTGNQVNCIGSVVCPAWQRRSCFAPAGCDALCDVTPRIDPDLRSSIAVYGRSSDRP